MNVEVLRGDITAESVDAIVNAANERLSAGGGVCGAIHAAGGPSIAAACQRIGYCPTGGAVATTAGDLRAKFVIHAVGPVWHGGNQGEPELLASAYVNALQEAQRVGARSIAFPAISTGIYGYPLEDAAAVAVKAVTGSAGDIQVRFVCFDDRTLNAYQNALKE